MGFARIVLFLIFLGGLYLLWLKIVKPILLARGVEVDEPEQIETSHTKELEKLQIKYEDKSASAKAAGEGLKLAKKIKELEEKIKDSDAEKVRL